MRKEDIRILIACEESQTICTAFRERGFTCYSCDLQLCSGGHPEWHVEGDVLPLLEGHVVFGTQDGETHIVDEWDLIIAHPPCTYMSKAGARWMYPTAGCISEERLALAMDAKDFFFKMYNANCKHIAVENPRPLKVVDLPQPSQVIQPYQYGEPFSKATCLWIKDLPLLEPTNIVSEYRPYLPSNTGGAKRGQKHSRGVAKNAKESSKTFKGIAEAIADQWGNYLLSL